MLQVSHCASEVTLKKKTKKARILIRTNMTEKQSCNYVPMTYFFFLSYVPCRLSTDFTSLSI